MCIFDLLCLNILRQWFSLTFQLNVPRGRQYQSAIKCNYSLWSHKTTASMASGLIHFIFQFTSSPCLIIPAHPIRLRTTTYNSDHDFQGAFNWAVSMLRSNAVGCALLCCSGIRVDDALPDARCPAQPGATASIFLNQIRATFASVGQ